METNYQRAYQWISDQVKDQIIGGRFKLPDTTFGVVRLLEEWGFDCIDDHGRSVYSGTDELAEKMAERAWQDPEVFEICCYLCSNSQVIGRPLPRAFELFSAAVLRIAARPARKGRPPTRWLERERIFNLAKEVSATFGLPLTRNEASSAISAADVVAEALTHCGRPTSFEEVRRLLISPQAKAFRDEVEELAKVRARTAGLDDLVELMGGTPSRRRSQGTDHRSAETDAELDS
jgi:hypothetical protein